MSECYELLRAPAGLSQNVLAGLALFLSVTNLKNWAGLGSCLKGNIFKLILGQDRKNMKFFSRAQLGLGKQIGFRLGFGSDKTSDFSVCYTLL